MTASTDPITIRRRKGQIWSHVRRSAWWKLLVTAPRFHIATERAAAAKLAADTAREVEEVILGQRPAPVVKTT